MTRALGCIALLLALAACGATSDSPGEPIACALAGAAELQPVCGVERKMVEGRLELTVRHPDGAFRRFTVVDDGRGMVAADGAHEAIVRYVDGHADVAIENDRYRFPASLRE